MKSMKTKLFCFTYAGSSADAVFGKWFKYCHPDIELIPIEYAGRGKRTNIPLYCSFEEGLNDVYDQVSRCLNGQRIAFFGHSLGALIAYELCHKLSAEDRRLVRRLIISGKETPLTSHRRFWSRDLSDEDFIRKVIELGGMSKETADEPLLMDYYLPILRSDFHMSESYVYHPKDRLLDVGMTILYGNNDFTMNHAQLRLWENLTTDDCIFHAYEGDHFFVNDRAREIVFMVNDTLRV